MNRNFTIFLCTFLLLGSKAKAGIISGKVTDSSNAPIPYASVYVKGSSQGTTTNFDGFYSFELQPGKYEMVFRTMGFKSQVHTINIGSEKIVLNIILMEEVLQTQGVIVKAGEDPAYHMIRSAIKARKHYLEQVKEYSCDAYIKGIQRLTKHPKKLLGKDISDDDLGLIDTNHSIIYLSESVSKFNFKRPDKIHEEMISSKVSGDNKAFSWNSATDVLFNFYENVMPLEGLSERGFISPIASDALFYYKYKLVGTYQENGQTVDKIEVIPKRKNDPVFRGYIYLEESGWHIYSTNLYLTKDAQIDFVDTLLINVTYIPVESDIWMPFNNKMFFHFGALGFKGNGMYMGVNSSFNIHPTFPKSYFNGEEMKVDEDANKKDTTYWHDTRPVPLTTEESDDYRTRDSIMKIRNSKKYLDSVDKKENKFKFGGFILGGYTYSNRYKKENISISPLLNIIQYNTVEGFRLGVGARYSKQLERNRHYYIQPSIHYGLSNQRLNGTIIYYYNYKPEKFRSFTMEGGRSAVQFNQIKPYSFLFNEFYTLFDKSNFMKLYQSDFFRVKHSMELINGVQFTASLKYESRSPLANTSFFTFSQDKNKQFTSNDPQGKAPEGQPSFTTNSALLFDAGFKINFQQRYYTRPYEKIVSESKYPTLELYYKKGINYFLGSNVNFDYIQASVNGKFNLKMLGHSTWYVTAGKFVNNNSMYFVDYYHFAGNQTIFTNTGGLELLPYYKYSTNQQFVQANFEHHFGGFILNKFPLIRKLKLGEIAGINYITANTLKQYLELYVGIEKLQTFQVIFVTGFTEGQKTMTTFRFGISSKGLINFN